MSPTSPLAAIGGCALGAAVVFALGLRARRTERLEALWSLAAMALLPIVLGVYLLTKQIDPEVIWIGIIGIEIVLAAGILLMSGPPRINQGTLLSLTVTFWTAVMPMLSGPHRIWVFPVIVLNLFVLAAGFNPRAPSAPMRLVLYLWSVAAIFAVCLQGVYANEAFFSDRELPFFIFMLAGSQLLMLLTSFFEFAIALPLWKAPGSDSARVSAAYQFTLSAMSDSFMPTGLGIPKAAGLTILQGAAMWFGMHARWAGAEWMPVMALIALLLYQNSLRDIESNPAQAMEEFNFDRWPRLMNFLLIALGIIVIALACADLFFLGIPKLGIF